jgi:hypothetical protein
MELIAGTGKPSEAQAFKAVMCLEVCETHLSLLSLIARSEKGFCLHLAACHIASILMQIARPKRFCTTKTHTGSRTHRR